MTTKKKITTKNVVVADAEKSDTSVAKKTTEKKSVKKTVKEKSTKDTSTSSSSDSINAVKKPKIKSLFAQERVVTENSNEARELYLQSRYGVVLDDGQVQLSLHEALYLFEKGKIEVMVSKTKAMTLADFIKKAKKIEPSFWIRYAVFKDMRNRGYIIKTALKFGADFRVYDRGVKPGEDHARWVVYPVHEGSTLTWYEFAAKNRVAHSTKKRLMLAVVDDESDVTYWEVKWVRP